jgi:dolichol kinase
MAFVVADQPRLGMTSPELDSLVHRTDGPQPWRRLFHAVNGVLAALALVTLDVSHATALAIVASVVAVLVALDVTRLIHPRTNALFFSAFRHLASPREASGLASSTWYALGILIAVAFFPLPAAVSGILVLALADPVASYAGRRWGRRPFAGATLEGTALFAAVAFCILAARHGPLVGALGAVVLAFAERFSWPLDDNLTIPVAGAAVVAALGTFL